MLGNGESYLNEALYDAKLRQLRTAYQKSGYVVDEEMQEQHPEFDLILKNSTVPKQIAYTVKVVPIAKPALQEIEQMQKTASDLGIDFRLVAINRPREPYIAIDWFKPALIDYIKTEAAAQFVNASGFTHIGDLAYIITEFVINGVRADLQINGEVILISGPTDNLEEHIARFGEESFQLKGHFILDLSQKKIVQGEISTAVSAL